MLIRIVAGDEEALANARDATGEDITLIREAAGFYLQQVLFAKDASSYRVLGVDPDASDERIREHYRWLARWLHPDRNPDAWEVVFSDRVSQAWQNMRTQERRARYDELLAMPAAPAVAAAAPEAARAVLRRTGYDLPPEPGRSLRWVPKAIFGGLGIVAVAVVAVFSIVQMGVGPAPERIAEIPPTPISPIPEPLPSAAAKRAEIPSETSIVPGDVAPAPASDVSTTRAPGAQTEAGPEVLTATTGKIETAGPSRAPQASSVKVPPSDREPIARARKEVPEVPRQVSPPPAPMAVAELVHAAEPSPPEPDATVSAPRFGQRDANRLLNRFSQAFEDGDIKRMGALFTDDIQGPQGGMRDILKGYERVFVNSNARTLSVRDVSYFATGNTLTIVASYSATVTRKNKTRHTTGSLRMDLRREQQDWRVFRLSNDEREG